MNQNIIISYLYETQHVSGDTPLIVRSLEQHWQPLVFYKWKVVGRVVGGRCKATQGDKPGTHLCWWPSAVRRIKSMKNPSYSIGNLTPDLPFCSAVKLYSKTMPFTINCMFRRERKKLIKLTIMHFTRKSEVKDEMCNKIDFFFLFLYKA
jgi:hypothetical protein